ncbi:MAG: alkaline shock response membrane anchor protein AmaP [Thermacetogeniaceae bacterium]
MKYAHIIYRILLVLYSIIVLFCAGVAIALLLGWTYPLSMISVFQADSSSRWGAIAISGFLVIMSFQLLAYATARQHEQKIIIDETRLGRIEIAASAIESLIRRAARQVRDIREVRPVLRYEQEGLGLFLHLSVNPEAHLPSVTQEIQQIVQEYLEEKAGVRVLQVDVRVENVSVEPRPRVE